jgi:hypothetical protein
MYKSRSSPVNCWWPSSAQSFLFASPFGTRAHIFVLSRLLRVLKWGGSHLRRGEEFNYYWSLPLYCGVTAVCHCHSLISLNGFSPNRGMHVVNYVYLQFWWTETLSSLLLTRLKTGILQGSVMFHVNTFPVLTFPPVPFGIQFDLRVTWLAVVWSSMPWHVLRTQ